MDLETRKRLVETPRGSTRALLIVGGWELRRRIHYAERKVTQIVRSTLRPKK